MKKFYKLIKPMMVSVFFLGAALYAYAQERTVTGTVKDASENAYLPGVNVLIKGTTSGTVTDVDGKYSLNVPADAVLVFSYVGYKNQEIPVGSNSVIDVNLTADVTMLQETVVIGYGTVKKSDATGSLSVISSADFNKGVVASPQ